MNDLPTLFGISRSPVAIGFFDSPPAGVPRWNGGAVPAGCAFWRKAMEGDAFYTTPEDHYNCAVGSHTHGIQLPTARAKELEETVGFMVANKYIEMSEVAGIPVWPKAPAAVAYAPVDRGLFAPDVVVVAANPGSGMLIYEAAVRARAGNGLTNVLGRPGCAVLPLAKNTGATALSFGCKGNRTFTGLGDEEMYFAIPGGKWPDVMAAAAEIAAANRVMQNYYEAKLVQVTGGTR